MADDPPATPTKSAMSPPEDALPPAVPGGPFTAQHAQPPHPRKKPAVLSRSSAPSAALTNPRYTSPDHLFDQDASPALPANRRSLTLRLRHFTTTASPSPSSSPRSSSASPSPTEETLRLSYLPPPPTPPDASHSVSLDTAFHPPIHHMSAARIQRAWRRYRTIESRSFCQFGGEAVRLVQRFISGRDADSLDAEELSTARAHLYLNFDVNKTILMSDAAKGASQGDMINMLISECAWGRMTVGPTWVPVGRLATDRPEGDPQLMTYRNFLDSFRYPYVDGTSDAALDENLRRKRLCGELQRAFTAAGHPGEMFSGVFHALAARLLQPPAERTPFFAAGQRRILPSFFELLLHLQATKRRFTLIFRTFGSDVEDVIEEMNLFATGRHPSYPGVYMDGRDGMTDLRLSQPASTGAYIRCGTRAAETILAFGVDQRVLRASRMSRKLVEEAATECGGVVLQGFADIRAALQMYAEPYAMQQAFAQRTSQRSSSSAGAPEAPAPAEAALKAVCGEDESGDKGPAPRCPRRGLEHARDWIASNRRAQNCALAIRDHYHLWKSRNEHPRAGKLLLLDPSDTSEIKMFFDDNIGYTGAHIADVRNARTGESVPFDEAKNTYLMRAEPVNAILDPKYFVRAVSEAELAILRKQERHTKKDTFRFRPIREKEARTPLGKGALLNLRERHRSGVARTSLAARYRWEWALRRVLIMSKVTRAFQESVI
eukprot:jgi/Ulvmu1/6847/UM031_0052.1